MSVENTVSVKILTQLAEPDHVRRFDSLLLSTTVKDLKARISQDLSSKPPVERIKMIHAGRMLSQDSATLKDILPASAAQQGGSFTIHTVIRDPQGQASEQANQAQQAGQFPRFGQFPQMPANAFPGGAVPPMLQNVIPPHMMPVMAQRGGPFPQQGQFVQQQTPFLPGLPQGAGAIAHPHAVPHNPQAAFNANAQNIMQVQLQHLQAQQRHLQQMMQGNNHTVQGPGSQGADNNRQSQGNSDSGTNAEARSTNLTTRDESTNIAGSVEQNSSQQQGEGQHNIQLPDGTGQMTIQEGVGPNGERWSISYGTGLPTPQTGPGVPPPGVLQPAFQNLVPAHMRAHMPGFGQQNHIQRNDSRNSGAEQRAGGQFMENWPGMPVLGTSPEFFGEAHALDSVRLYQRDIDDLHGRIRSHTSSASVPRSEVANNFDLQLQNIVRMRNRAQAMVNQLLTPGDNDRYHQGLSADAVNSLQLLNQRFSRRVREITQELRSWRSRAQQHQASSPNTSLAHSASRESTAQSFVSQNGVSSNSDQRQSRFTTTYLLNSPAGPRAVVFSPQGTFSNNGVSISGTDATTRSFQSVANSVATPFENVSQQNRLSADQVAQAYQTLNNVNQDLQSIQQSLANAANQIQHQEQADQSQPAVQRAQNQQQALRQFADQLQNMQQNAANEQNQPRNEVNADLVPLFQQMFRHLWLMIRVFGCIWLLTRGASTRRTVLILTSTIFYLLLQAGVFGERPFERFRQWFEQVVGVDDDQRRQRQQRDQRPEQGGAEGHANRDQQRGDRARRRGDPGDPQALARRLLQERHDQSWLRTRFQGIERSIALFVASLYPGVGERHVQARERVIREAREAEQRQRQEAAASENVEDGAQQEQAQVPQAADSDDSTGKARSDHAPSEGTSTSVSTSGQGELRDRTNATRQ